MSVLQRLGRLFGRKRERGWNWSIESSTPAPSIAPLPVVRPPVVEEHLTTLEVTEPTVSEETGLKGRVVLGFKDGTELVLQDTNPLVGEFVRAADRMMRPAGWRRLFGPKVGL